MSASLRGCLLAATLGLSAVALVAAFPPARAQGERTECEPLMIELEVHQRTIDTVRHSLSPAEARCALAGMGAQASPECAKVMAKAVGDALKRQAWIDAMMAWSELDRLKLELRALEQRTGVKCKAP